MQSMNPGWYLQYVKYNLVYFHQGVKAAVYVCFLAVKDMPFSVDFLSTDWDDKAFMPVLLHRPVFLKCNPSGPS